MKAIEVNGVYELLMKLGGDEVRVRYTITDKIAKIVKVQNTMSLLTLHNLTNNEWQVVISEVMLDNTEIEDVSPIH